MHNHTFCLNPYTKHLVERYLQAWDNIKTTGGVMKDPHYESVVFSNKVLK